MTKKDIAEETINKCRDRMNVAKLLIQKGHFEDSMSRTYYAFFDAIRGMLEIEKVTAKSHQGAINKFNELFIKKGIFDKKFGKIIKKVKDLRETADYTFQLDASKSEAKEVFEEAEEFVFEIEKYLKEKFDI